MSTIKLYRQCEHKDPQIRGKREILVEIFEDITTKVLKVLMKMEYKHRILKNLSKYYAT